jgi:flagellin
MGLRINTNTQSLAAQRHLGNTNNAQRASLEKMASGSRITKASDDAAGLAISEKMRGQIRSLNQGTRNANDGIGLIQTAEGGMNEVGNILVRMRELSIQAASDTIGESERAFVDKEVQALKSEVQRIADSTEYNGRKLLAGEGEVLEFQIGPHNNPTQDRFQFDQARANVSVDRLGIGSVSTISKASAQENLTILDGAINTLMENRSELGALQNRMQATVANNQIYAENLSGARSRIADVDVASETAELTRFNILGAAGTAVLSQANQNAQQALKLI